MRWLRLFPLLRLLHLLFLLVPSAQSLSPGCAPALLLVKARGGGGLALKAQAVLRRGEAAALAGGAVNLWRYQRSLEAREERGAPTWRSTLAGTRRRWSPPS